MLNLGARYTVKVRDFPLTVRFNVLNATNANYYQSSGGSTLSLAAPRTFLASMALRFENEVAGSFSGSNSPGLASG